MAEFGAHLTASLGEKPSIFEVLATDGLAKGLKLAFKHLATVVAQNNPSRYGLLQRFDEEFYLLIDFFVQYYHLKKYSASFAENFYGLRRTPRPRNRRGRMHLTKKQFRRSLFLLIGLPYLLSLIHKRFIKLREESQNDQRATEDIKTKLKKLFLVIYPYAYFLGNTVSFSYQLLYAVGKLNAHSPIIQVSLCELRTLTDIEMKQSQERQTSEMLEENQRFSVRQLLYKLATALSSTMSIGAFYLQFVDWFYSQEGTRKSIGARCIPDAPKNTSVYNPGICPICQNKARNQTVLLTSGYVFCYRCIHQSLTANPQCPVTKYPANHAQLIKLYPPED